MAKVFIIRNSEISYLYDVILFDPYMGKFNTISAFLSFEDAQAEHKEWAVCDEMENAPDTDNALSDLFSFED